MEIESYDWSQVQSALERIDKDKYPDRHDELIERKEELESQLLKIDKEYQVITGQTISEKINSEINMASTAEIFINSGAGMAIIWGVMIISALLGGNVISWDGEYSHGFGAIVIGVIFWFVLSLLFGLLNLIGVKLLGLIVSHK